MQQNANFFSKIKHARPDETSGRAALTDAGVDGGARADHNFFARAGVLC
jgi:hypothetical protein